MLTFEEYLQKEKDMKEDEMVAAAPASSSGIVSDVGTTAGDILGKCDHQNHGGFMGKDCNHIPKPLQLEPARRTKKKKKTQISQLSEVELDRKLIQQLHKVRETDILKYLKHEYGTNGNPLTDDIYVDAIVYNPVSELLFIKVVDTGGVSGKSLYCIADFDPNTLKFSNPKDLDPKFKNAMTAAEAKAAFKKILSMPGNSPINAGSDDMKLWVVWGSL